LSGEFGCQVRQSAVWMAGHVSSCEGVAAR
jgi:hypothetical protein